MSGRQRRQEGAEKRSDESHPTLPPPSPIQHTPSSARDQVSPVRNWATQQCYLHHTVQGAQSESFRSWYFRAKDSHDI